jgi:hypothetical protein
VFETLMKEIERYAGGEYTYTDEAFEVFDTLYQSNIDLQDYRLESYLNRRHVHYYKLCIVIAALNLTKVITKDIAVLANTILHYTERDMPTALGEFGKNLKGDVNTRLLNAVDKYHKSPENEGIPLSPERLFKKVQTDFDGLDDFGKSLQKLRSGSRIEYREDKGFIVGNSKAELQVLPYVDFNLMPEYNQRKI